jgi:hypothetical protein
MKITALLLALLLPIALHAERPIQVKVDWLNHGERQCKGCSTQIITNKSGGAYVVAEQCDEGDVFLKVVARWKGDAIEVALTRQIRRGERKFEDDGPGASVLVHAGESRQVELRGFKYAVSANAAPEMPNQSPEPTVMLVTPRADARVAPSTTVAHL